MSETMTFRAIVCCATSLTVCALLTSSADAQSLGAVARKEQARRQTAVKGKVYTNESLPELPPPPPARAASPGEPTAVSSHADPSVDAAQSQQDAVAAEPAPQAAAGASDDKAAGEPKDEAYWRTRMATAREALSRSQSFADALQSRINALSADFVNRDDPAQRNVIAGDRDKALAELDRVRKEVQANEKAIATVQDEARREGAPAGWVR